MKKYQYVQVHMNKFIGSELENHRKIIDEFAKRGYRYVGFIPTSLTEYGKIKDIDLIFEIDV